MGLNARRITSYFNISTIQTSFSIKKSVIWHIDPGENDYKDHYLVIIFCLSLPKSGITLVVVFISPEKLTL